MSQQLHDRATRGEQLTQDEMAQLEAWYAQNDQDEANELSRPNIVESDPLRQRLDAALAELAETASRVRQRASAVESLRRENDKLRRQLAARSATHGT